MSDFVSPGGDTGTGTGGSSTSSGSGGSPSPSPTSGTGGSGSGGSLTSPPSSGSAGTSDQPGAQGATASQPHGPVDYTRFEEVNSRYNQLRWAEEYEPTRVAEATRIYEWFDTDPMGAYNYFTDLLTRGGYIRPPQQQPQGRSNGHDRFSDPNTGRPLPDIEVQENGARLYSADQAGRLVDWAMNRMEERVRPIEERIGSQQVQTQAREDARRQIAEASRTWPHFEEFAEDIYKEISRDRRLSLEGAYRRVAIPRIKQKEREAMSTEMRTRAQASGGQNPGSSVPGSTEETRKLPLRDLFRREMRRRGMGS